MNGRILLFFSLCTAHMVYAAGPTKQSVMQAIDGLIKAGYGRSDIFANAQANINASAENQIVNLVNQTDKSLLQTSNDLGDLQSELTGTIYTVSQNIGKAASIQYLPDYLQDIQTTLGKLQGMSISGSNDASAVLDYYRKQLISVAQRAISQLSAKIKGTPTTTSGKVPWVSAKPSVKKPLPTPPAKGSRPPQKPVPQAPAAKQQPVDVRSAVFGGAAVRDSTSKLAQPAAKKPTLLERIKGFFVKKK